MTQKPELTVTESDNLPEVGPTEADLDPAAWLARDDALIKGRIKVQGGYLVCGGLTEAEYQKLRNEIRQVNPRNPTDPNGIVDNAKLSRKVIAYSINKANGLIGTGNEIKPDSLMNKLTGDNLELMRGILRLSGLQEAEEREAPIPFT